MPTALLRMIGQQADALDRMAGLELARPAAASTPPSWER